MSVKSLLPCSVTYSQLLRISVWTSLGVILPTVQKTLKLCHGQVQRGSLDQDRCHFHVVFVLLCFVILLNLKYLETAMKTHVHFNILF